MSSVRLLGARIKVNVLRWTSLFSSIDLTEKRRHLKRPASFRKTASCFISCFLVLIALEAISSVAILTPLHDLRLDSAAPINLVDVSSPLSVLETTTSTNIDGDRKVNNIHGVTSGHPSRRRPSEIQRARKRLRLPGGPGADHERRAAVKDAFVHVWGGYEKHAWGADGIGPVTRQPVNWAEMGVTLVEALDTLFIMDMKDEFDLARQWVHTALRFDTSNDLLVYDLVRGVIGGLLAAFDLSGDSVLYSRAHDLASKLLDAFDTPTGLPAHLYNMKTRTRTWKDWTGRSAVLAHIGGMQLEFRELAYHSGDASLRRKMDNMLQTLRTSNSYGGLYPSFVDPITGNFTNGLVTLGAFGGAFYEALLKIHLQSGEDESTSFVRSMYDESVTGLVRRMMRISRPSRLLYFPDYDVRSSKPTNKFEQSACSLAGLLMMGSVGSSSGGSSGGGQQERRIAEGLMETCYRLWSVHASGLSPDSVFFNVNDDDPNADDFRIKGDFYHLRGETIESLFYMWRFTKNEKYREWGWNIFQSIELCRTEVGYCAVEKVGAQKPTHTDAMQTHFLSKTLKYMYLLFSEDELIPLDSYVFTGGGHPLKIFPVHNKK